jgi:putative membrane protein
MIVKRNFHPAKIWPYVWRPMLWVLGWAVGAWALQTATGSPALCLNFTPIGILGSALAIFVAFRNNAAYGRWWEARQIWGQVVHASRVLARLAITFADSHAHQANYVEARSEAFKRRMVYLILAWAHALRLHLRRQEGGEELRRWMGEADFRQVDAAQHKPNMLHLLMGRAIYQAMADGTLGGFDSFQMEGQLLSLSNSLAAAERIKHTPLPRQYDFFTRMFVLAFAALLPFGLLGFFQTEALLDYRWLAVPLSALVAGAFVVMERTGAANEDPFEHLPTDVPMSALCVELERDLREMLGERELPAAPVPSEGYLY